jgi:hypothetical protein
MADNSSIQTAIQDLKAQSAAGGGGAPVTTDGKPPVMSQALSWINRGIHEKDVMAMEVTGHKTYGVQFHPESIETHVGMDIIRNFLKLC